MLQELQDIGLSEKEAAVYMAALELGPSTADQLAKQSKVRRSTTYVQVESLMKKGLMSTYEKGKKTLFAPESPTGLKRIVQEQQRAVEAKSEDLNTLLPDLTRMFESAGERPLVRFFEGKEGVVSLKEEVLNTRNKTISVISSADALSSSFTFDELEEYSKMRIKKGVTTRLIYTRKSGKFSDPAPKLTERAYIEEQSLPLATDIVIFDNNVGVMALKGNISGVMIENTKIKESMMSIFNFLWQQAEHH